jgi:hypothetical protein
MVAECDRQYLIYRLLVRFNIPSLECLSQSSVSLQVLLLNDPLRIQQMDVLGQVLWVSISSLRDDDALFRAVHVGGSHTCSMAAAISPSTAADGGGLWVSSYFKPERVIWIILPTSGVPRPQCCSPGCTLIFARQFDEGRHLCGPAGDILRTFLLGFSPTAIRLVRLHSIY